MANQRAQLPAPRPSGYVGSEACNDCHQDIASAYKSHPMSRSAAANSDLSEDGTIESFQDAWLDIEGPFHYRVVKKGDGRLLHEQASLNESGDRMISQVEEIDFEIGSGQKGRAYLVEKQGDLFQSPVGWYSTTNRWDLSPGYAPERHHGFQRKIDDSCLYCHVSNANSTGNGRYGDPTFHETAIGCERCHGPGEGHIAFHLDVSTSEDQEPEPDAQDPIVNPSNLAPTLREDVCNQCHLQAEYVIRRFGREFFDFRPGDRLEDIFVIFISGARSSAEAAPQAVSHVEQLRISQCYQGASGEMGCASCHDPHSVPTASDRIDFYRNRCLECHEDRHCEVPLAQRIDAPEGNSCIECHMPKPDTSNVPHTAQTDHRILREPTGTKEKPRTGSPWEVFNRGRERLPVWEVARATGIAMMASAWIENDQREALQARDLLLPRGAKGRPAGDLIQLLGKDHVALIEIGASYWITGPQEMSRPYWERAVEVQPQSESALGGLALLEIQQGNLRAADQLLSELTELAPNDPQWFRERARLYWQTGRQEDAVSDAQQALELDPFNDRLRQWLESVQEEE